MDACCHGDGAALPDQHLGSETKLGLIRMTLALSVGSSIHHCLVRHKTELMVSEIYTICAVIFVWPYGRFIVYCVSFSAANIARGFLLHMTCPLLMSNGAFLCPV